MVPGGKLNDQSEESEPEGEAVLRDRLDDQFEEPEPEEGDAPNGPK